MTRESQRRWWFTVALVLLMMSPLAFAGGIAYAQSVDPCDPIEVEPCDACTEEDCAPFIDECDECDEPESHVEPKRKVKRHRCPPCNKQHVSDEARPAYIYDLHARYIFDDAVAVGGTWNWNLSERVRPYVGAVYDWGEVKETFDVYYPRFRINDVHRVEIDKDELRLELGVTIGFKKQR